MVTRILVSEISTSTSGLGILDQLLDLADRLPRHDDAGHAFGAGGRIDLRLGEAVAVGRHGAQHRLAGDGDDVEVDAVQVVARLLGRDGELGAVDELLQRRRGQA